VISLGFRQVQVSEVFKLAIMVKEKGKEKNKGSSSSLILMIHCFFVSNLIYSISTFEMLTHYEAFAILHRNCLI
jgi:hypothetical protein